MPQPTIAAHYEAHFRVCQVRNYLLQLTSFKAINFSVILLDFYFIVDSNSSLDKDKESDCESVDSKKTQLECASDGDSISLRKKTSSQLKKFLGSTVRKTVGKAKMMAHEVSQHARQKEEMFDIPDELTGGEQHVKMKVVELSNR